MAVTFTVYITDEGIRATREVQQNPGWYIIPYEFRVSDTKGVDGVNAGRTYASIDPNPWYSGEFSALTESGTENKIIHTVVIPPVLTTAPTEKNYGEVYFIYKNHNNEEILFAIGEPDSELTYTPGISQKFYFSFALNNVQVKDTIIIQNTDPQDIDDHNIDPNAHVYKANVGLDNLDENGEARFTAKANISLNNLNSTGLTNTSVYALEHIPLKIIDTSHGNLPLQNSKYVVTLTDNSAHMVTIPNNTTNTVQFVLPSVNASLGIYHQMIITYKANTKHTINFGTTKYFYGEAPDTDTAGAYTFIYEYDGTNWVVGGMYKGTN